MLSSAIKPPAARDARGQSASDPAASHAALPRRGFGALAIATMLAATALGACSTTDGSGSGAEGSGSGSGSGGVDRNALGRSLTADQLREALAREGVSDRILFGYDSHDLSPEARTTVEKWARVLNQAGGTRVAIEGHCDERGTREYNLALGERRANSVRSYLASLGIPAARVQTISFGKEKPVVVGSSEQSWAQNRRGVLAVD